MYMCTKGSSSSTHTYLLRNRKLKKCFFLCVLCVLYCTCIVVPIMYFSKYVCRAKHIGHHPAPIRRSIPLGCL